MNVLELLTKSSEWCQCQSWHRRKLQNVKFKKANSALTFSFIFFELYRRWDLVSFCVSFANDHSGKCSPSLDLVHPESWVFTFPLTKESGWRLRREKPVDVHVYFLSSNRTQPFHKIFRPLFRTLCELHIISLSSLQSLPVCLGMANSFAGRAENAPKNKTVNFPQSISYGYGHGLLWSEISLQIQIHLKNLCLIRTQRRSMLCLDRDTFTQS